MTDRRTDRQTDRQTDIMITIPLVLPRGKNDNSEKRICSLKNINKEIAKQLASLKTENKNLSETLLSDASFANLFEESFEEEFTEPTLPSRIPEVMKNNIVSYEYSSGSDEFDESQTKETVQKKRSYFDCSSDPEKEQDVIIVQQCSSGEPTTSTPKNSKVLRQNKEKSKMLHKRKKIKKEEFQAKDNETRAIPDVRRSIRRFLKEGIIQ